VTSILILPEFLIDVPGQTPRMGWGVRITGSRVDVVAPLEELLARFPDDHVLEAPGQVLAPGFVDAHTHLYGVLAHGIPLDRAPSGFWPFLEEFWWPMVEDRLNHEMICAATDLNLVAMLRGGVTAFYDCTEAPRALPGCLAAQADVVRRRGIRGILSFEATQRVSPENGELGLQENLSFIRACRATQAAGSPPLVSGLMCFHTTFTCEAPFIVRAFALAAEEGAPVHMHVSEGTYEPERLLDRSGLRSFEYYERLGVTGPNMLASQCVQITPEEIEIIARRGVRVTHMPLSNCEVGGGIAPVPDLLAAGVTMGLGSDGYITDFFEVMRGAFLIHKAHRQDPRVMPASAVWHLATEGGARAIGLEGVGRLAPGWQADAQLIDAVFPTPATVQNLYEQLLLYRNATHVRMVMVGGQVLVREGVVLGADYQTLQAQVHRAARALWPA
jgi:cytosine/adenosine deaminase-related metal-dependent hydrolase